tara:strand:+ start:2197 stop:4257 length:2061 start_codon:yes stop_codon:yes gene_type:complete
MSKVQVDKVVNLSDDGAPQLTYGAELPVGYGLTGAGGLNISGVVTAASAVFSGNVTIGGTLTYEDVTNIDVVGVSTFAGRMNVNSTINANEGINITGVSTMVGNQSVTGSLTVQGSEGNSGILQIFSDEGDDNEDKYRFLKSSGNHNLVLQNYTGGSWTTNVTFGNDESAAFGGAISATTGTFTGDVDIADKIIHTGDTNTAIRFPSADTITAETGGSERVRLTSDGKVGINQTPTRELSIHSPDNNNSQIHFTNDDTGETASDGIVIGLDGNEDLIVNNQESSKNIKVFNGGSERVRLTSAGDVGIGTNSPASGADLHLHAESTAVRMQFTNSNTGVSDSDGVRLMIDSSNNFEILQREDANIEFFTDNSERMRLDGDGRLLIGATAARTESNGLASPLQIEGTSTATSSVIIARNSNNASSSQLIFQKSRGTSVGSNTVIQSGDAVGTIIFEGSDGTNTDPLAQIIGACDGTPGNNDMPGRLVFGTTADGSASPSETMRLMRSGSHGNMYLNTTSQVETSVFSVSSNGSATIGSKVTADNTQTHIIFANGNGNVGNITTNGSATSYNTSSDYRLKENAAAISDGITRLKTLKPYRFNWKSVGVGTTVDGFFAHEVTAVPEAITGTKDLVTTSSDVSAGIATAVGIPIYQGIDQSKLVPLLTAALQEAVTKIETLETKVAALESS